MKFMSPIWLWGLLLLPLFYLLAWWDEKRKQDQFAVFAHRRLWSFISPEMDLTYRLRKMRRYLPALGFALVALARPQLGTHEETVDVTGLDIMLALDVSNSMYVEDVVPSRLQKAKHLVQTLTSHLDGDRVGVVAFAGSSYVASPLTTDLAYLWETVQILGPRMIQNQGTDVGLALDTALQSLERGGEEDAADTSGGAAASHVILLISDGEDHEEKAIQIASQVKKTGAKLYILGVGTQKGGPIPLKDEAGVSQGFKKDRTGQPVMSSFKPDFLKKVAEAAGGKYWDVTTGEAEVNEVLKDLGALNRADYAERRFTVYEERYQIPLALAILLFLLEISIPARKLARSGLTVGVLALLVFLVSNVAQADGVALPSVRGPAPLDVYRENKKGLDAYQDSQLDEAQKSFGAAQARDPSRPELYFNQGTVFMRKEEWDSALDAFRSAALAAQQRGDLKLQGKALYNMGNAFAKKGSLKEAARFYLDAIQNSKGTQDTALENEARKNLQLLHEEIKKQKQKKKDQEDKEKKESKKENGKESDQTQQAGQDKNKKEDGKKADEKSPQKSAAEKRFDQEAEKKASRQKFESKKMTPDDADRVMAELKTRERELRERLQTQNAKSQNHAKDW